MKTVIYYFTGTGNSLALARSLAKGIGDTELVPIAKAINENISISADRIGMVFPVYVWGPPLIVAEFIKNKKMNTDKNKYIFAVANCGGFPGGAINVVRKLLEEKGLKLAVGYSIRMPGNYTPMYGAIPEEKQKKMFEDADTKIKKITEDIKTAKEGIYENSSFLVRVLFTGMLYNKGISSMRKADKNYWADDNCKKCNMCEKVCPVNNIRQEKDEKPVWLGKCEQCLACMQWCPVSAIQFGKSTINRKRYRHPDITFNDIVAK